MRIFLRSLFDLLLLTLLGLVIAALFDLVFGFVVFGIEFDNRRLDKLVFYLFAALGARYILFSLPTAFDPLSHDQRLKQHAIRGLLYFVLTVIVVKSFISLLVVHHFKQEMTGRDLIFTYAFDLGLAMLLALVLLVGVLIEHSKLKFGPLQRGKALIYVGVSVVPLLLSVFYVLCGYSYFEWGSYLEPHHYEAMRMARVGAEFVDIFFRWKTLVAFGAIGLLYLLSSKLQRATTSSAATTIGTVTLLAIGLLPFALMAPKPIDNPRLFSPAVASPLYLMRKPVAGNQDGVKNRNLLENIDAAKFVPEKVSEIPEQFRHLRGIAQVKNVVFFILESVRRRNVGLYGYFREPMPTFSRLADNALVFQNAYVMQPRSSKAMAALALGVMPDPRLRPISWDPRRIEGKDTLFVRLLNQGRRFYQGTAQPYGGDKLQAFFLAASHHVEQPVVSLETLQEDPSLPDDDVGLAQHFLRWVKSEQQPFVGLLWTECAHMPYLTEEQPYGDKDLVDRYDNCLRQTDESLRTVVEGLDELGELDNTLFLILGDHGEALGENFDQGHGNYLFEHSMRIPFIIYNPAIFKKRIDVMGRFQLKDIPTTLLYLMGLPEEINQSVNIFTKGPREKLYMSNVYQDFKLGILIDRIKFVYRPRFDMTYMYDLDADPEERINISNRYSRKQLEKLKRDALTWYKFQSTYIEQNYPEIGKRK